MSQIRRIGTLCTVLLALLTQSTGCGSKEDPNRAPPGAIVGVDRRADSTIDLTLGDDPMASVANQLVKTKAPTVDVLSGLAAGRDPEVVALIDDLRGRILTVQNGPWRQPGDDIWGQRRCCQIEALDWSRAVVVEVHTLQLPAAVAEGYGSQGKYAPLLVAKVECLEAAVKSGHLVGSYGPIVLRGGETARLTAGWTRARAGAYFKDGRVLRETCVDAFAGVRLAVSARVVGGETGAWEIGVFTASGGLRNEVEAQRRGADWFGQMSETQHDVQWEKENRLSVVSKEGCWLARLRGQWEKSEMQVLLCARVVETK